MYHRRRPRLVLLGIFLLAAGALAGCGKRAAQGPTAGPGSGSPETSGSATNPAFRASLVEGADQSVLRAYLTSVREVKPSRFEVEWSKDVVPVSREEALRALRAVNGDGSAFTFASTDPVVPRLVPGKIVWIWGIAIRRIDRIGITDDGTIVHTSPVALNEAIPRADIEFATPVDFGTAYGVYRPRSSGPPPKTVTRIGRPSPLRLVRYDPAPQPAPQPGAGDQPPTDPGNPTLQQTETSDMVAATTKGYAGEVAGFQFSLGYRVSQSTLHLELQARKADQGGPGSQESGDIQSTDSDKFYQYVEQQWHAEQDAKKSYDRIEKLETEIAQIDAQSKGKASNPGLNAQRSEDEQAKLIAISDYRHAESEAEQARIKAKALAARNDEILNIFLMASENLDVRFRAKADLNRATLNTVLKLQPGSNAGTAVNINDLSGNLDLEFVARLGSGGNGGVSIPVAHVPVMFNIPLVVGGIPFVVQVGADFLAKVGLGGNHAAHHFHARFEFSGGAGTLASASSQTDTNFNLSGSEPQVDEPTMSSPGVSGSVLAVQIPRLGVGLGVWGVAAVMYVDHVTVVTMTNAASVATLNPPCTRVTIDRVAHVGGDVTTVMPIPIVEQILHALSWNKEIWRAKQWLKVKPDIAMCKI
jgi:hypothetical protein